MATVVPAIKVAEEAKNRRQVLVVDDSRAQRHLLARTLSRWDFDVIEAESGEVALGIIKGRPVDLVISDWMMPGMSGVEFCKEYRKLRAGDPGYFILLTAQTDRQALADGLDGGADDFLSKPFHATELRARINAGVRVLTAQRDLRTKNQLLSETLEELQELYTSIDRDLREARSFQEALVPDRQQRIPGGDISFLFRPSGHVGGDLVGFFGASNERYGVFSVDVAGHGVASALMTARISGLLSATSPERNLGLTTTNDGRLEILPPDVVCRRLNELILNDVETDNYFTMVFADVDLSDGRVLMAQAGHPSPVLQRADGSVEYISSFGMPIGLIEDAEYSAFEIFLAPGDRLLLYSDGFTECPIGPDRQLEEDGLEELLLSLSNKKTTDLLDALVNGLSARSGLREFPDDLSAVLIERTVGA